MIRRAFAARVDGDRGGGKLIGKAHAHWQDGRRWRVQRGCRVSRRAVAEPERIAARQHPHGARSCVRASWTARAAHHPVPRTHHELEVTLSSHSFTEASGMTREGPARRIGTMPLLAAAAAPAGGQDGICA
jgi:hypothetical protein